jgi:CMP-N-acetylneuraminic acid synthetase
MKKNNNGYLVKFINRKTINRRQDKTECYARNGAAIYATKYPYINNYIIGGNIIAFLMNKKNSIDIDTYEDLKIAENFLLKK